MNVQRASFDTKARTWFLLAALTAPLHRVGAAIGGAALWFFVLFSVFMNVAAYCCRTSSRSGRPARRR